MRKSLDIDESKNEVKELYIITEQKPYTVHDFLPSYSLKYEGIKDNLEAEAMTKALIKFIESNEQIVLDEYNSKHIEAIQEGFKRAVSLAELFIRSLYLEDGLNDRQKD